MELIKIKKGETLPALEGVVKEDGAAKNLSGATVTIIIRKPSGSVITQSVTISDAAAGTIKYQWVASDFSEGVGRYRYEIDIDFGGSETIRIPDEGTFEVHITQNLE